MISYLWLEAQVRYERYRNLYYRLTLAYFEWKKAVADIREEVRK